jgi:SAM-dependent methyltransferase
VARVRPVDVYPEIAFGGYSRVDGTMDFLARAHALAPSEGTILDIGCGRGEGVEDRCRARARLCDFRRAGVKVVGIDVDPSAAGNPIIDEFRPLRIGEPWPIESASVDLAVSRSVIEHVDDVPGYFREIARVLKPGGFLAAHTSNLWSYPGIAARLVPNRLHGRAISMAQPGRQERDVFPTLYRCNSVWKLRRTLREAGLSGTVYGIEAEPSYVQFSRVAYRVAATIHSYIPSAFRSRILVYARR